MTHQHGVRESGVIERELDQTRQRIDERAQELQTRMSPTYLVDQAIARLRTSRSRDFFVNLGRAVSQNPLPVTLSGLALGWLAITSRHSRAGEGEGEREHDGPSPAGEAMRNAAEKAREAGHELADKSRELGRRVREGAREGKERVQETVHEAWSKVHDQPMVLGLLGIAAGAALGASLPHTDVEDEVAGPASDALKKKAVEKGRERIEDVRHNGG